jgi:hypothetical protein
VGLIDELTKRLASEGKITFPLCWICCLDEYAWGIRFEIRRLGWLVVL